MEKCDEINITRKDWDRVIRDTKEQIKGMWINIELTQAVLDMAIFRRDACPPIDEEPKPTEAK